MNSNVGDRRARDAEVFPLAGSNDGLDDASAGAAADTGQRFWRQDSRCGDGRGGLRSRLASVKIHEAFDTIAVNIRTFTTFPMTMNAGARRCAQRKARRRGDHSGAVFAAGFCGRLARRSGWWSTTPTSTMSSSLEAEMQSVVDCAECSVIPAAVVQTDRAGDGGALSVCRVYEVSALRLGGTGDVCLGDDRRRHAVYRRQGARRA